MNESGVNSFDEFLLLYLFAGFVIALFWAALEADVVLGPVNGYGHRHARRLRLTRWLAPLGLLHVAFALVALDASRLPSDVPVEEDATIRRRRAATEAQAFVVFGLLLLLLVALPHLPVLHELPAADALAERAPWE